MLLNPFRGAFHDGADIDLSVTASTPNTNYSNVRTANKVKYNPNQFGTLQIKSNPKTYINDPACYNGTIEDLLTICEYNLKNYKEAYIYVNKALKYNPNEPRLLRNKEIIEKLI